MIWLITVLATARAIRLVADDEFPFGPFRAWAEENRPWLGSLLGCPWCVSGYLSAISIGVVWTWGPDGVPVPGLSWFALWMAALIVYHFCEMLAKYASHD